MCLIKDYMCWLHQIHNIIGILHGYIYSTSFRNINNINIKIDLENKQYYKINNDSIQL